MKNPIAILLYLFISTFLYGQEAVSDPEKRVHSRIDSSAGNELVLIQEFTVNAPLGDVWDAYTTASGWESWAVPLAEIKFEVGGTIKTNYNENGEIGDSTTIVTHIVNYVPNRLITLQAEITDNFPDFMKAEAEDFYNVICFREIDGGQTAVESYGIGYKNTPKFLSLMNYFISANEATLMKLIQFLEAEN